MTIKTTKEQRDELLSAISDPNFCVYNWVVQDLCHDTNMARELEMLYEQRGLYLQDAEATMADLRTKLEWLRQEWISSFGYDRLERYQDG